MSLDARSPNRDTPTHVDRSHRACGTSRPLTADEEITVLRLAGVRETRAPQAFNDDATVLRFARRAHETS